MATKKTETDTEAKAKTTRTKAKAKEPGDLLSELPVGEGESEALDNVAADIADEPDENVYDETPILNESGEEVGPEPVEVADYAIEIETREQETEAGVQRKSTVRVRYPCGTQEQASGF